MHWSLHVPAKQALSLADLASYAAVMRNADMVAPLQMMNEIDDLAQRLLLTEWKMKNKCNLAARKPEWERIGYDWWPQNQSGIQ